MKARGLFGFRGLDLRLNVQDLEFGGFFPLGSSFAHN